jgi:hypothetical protein
MANKAKVKNSAPVIGTESQDEALKLAMGKGTKDERRDAASAFMLIEERAARKAIQDRGKALMERPKKGRPTTYNADMGEMICERLARGESLASVCEGKGMPGVSTVFQWIAAQPVFAEGYARARDIMAHAIFDECLAIADEATGDIDKEGTPNNTNVQRAKLRIDTRFRMAGKLNPKVYSDRMEQLGANPVTINNNTLNIDARALDAGQRDSLRQLLLSAQNGAKDS